jgi:hypothetical protein
MLSLLIWNDLVVLFIFPKGFYPIREWKKVTDRFIKTKGSDFKSVDDGTWNNAKVMKKPNYEYIQGESSRNGSILIFVRSNGTWAMAHSGSYFRQGTWKWDGSKIIAERGITKNAKGLFSDSDTDMIKSIYTENKVGNVGARGPVVKKIQNTLINSMELNAKNFPNEYDLLKKITKDYDGCKSNWSKCDGIYGQVTKEIVKNKQKELGGYSVDGIWGKEMMQYYKDEASKYGNLN